MVKEIMHVRIDNSINTRKEILKTALDTTRLLKDFEKFKDIRERKTNEIKKLHKVFKEIKLLKSHLKRYGLPSLPEDVKKEIAIRQKKVAPIEKPIKVITPKEAIKVKKKVTKKKIVKKQKTPTDKLSADISEIENMLKNL